MKLYLGFAITAGAILSLAVVFIFLGIFKGLLITYAMLVIAPLVLGTTNKLRWRWVALWEAIVLLPITLIVLIILGITGKTISSLIRGR